MKMKYAKIVLLMLCAIMVICICEKEVHYETFDELLASEELSHIPDEERELRHTFYILIDGGVTGCNFRHLDEYDHLSESILEFTGKVAWQTNDMTWYYPAGRDNSDILILVNGEGEASLWKEDLGEPIIAD